MQPRPGTFKGATCKTFDVSLSTRYERVSGIVTSAKWQAIKLSNAWFWECLRICQLVNTHFLFTGSITLIWPLNRLHPNRLAKEAADRLRAPAELAPRFFTEQKITESRASSPYCHHVATERAEEFTPFCAAVEQRSFAHTVLPLGSLPLLLTEVAPKTWTLQATHTVRGQSRWDGLCRITQTAVAPWNRRSITECREAEWCSDMFFKLPF